MRQFRVAVLNIVMPVPHSPRRYIELLQAAYQRRRIVSLRGDYAGMLGGLNTDNEVIRGQFYKFFNLNVDSTWFNLSNQQEAEPDDLAQIRVPSHLKPHHLAVNFVFVPQKHRLIFVTRDGRESLSPGMAKSLLDSLFSEPDLVQSFGEIEITIEPSREQLRRIFAMPRLKKLSIEVSPPNPDDLDEAERDVLDRMSEERAQRMMVELVSKHPRGLQPDATHRLLARVAQSNGKVSGHGEDEQGNTITLSTKDHPLVKVVSYDPDIQTRNDALTIEAQALVQALRD